MILKNRHFERIVPSREAKSIYIFCEGGRTELNYFKYFKELDSRINIEVYKLHSEEDNSPLGLWKIAEKCIVKTKENPNPKYSFIDGDDVWIVLDIDKDKHESRKPQIQIIKEKFKGLDGWYLSQSNPCFEVWLYYHFHPETPNFEDSGKCKNWKPLVNESIKGGFDPRKHPIFIETASTNAKNNFQSEDGELNIGSTEVYNLANSIISIVKPKLDKYLKNLKSDQS